MCPPLRRKTGNSFEQGVHGLTRYDHRSQPRNQNPSPDGRVLSYTSNSSKSNDSFGNHPTGHRHKTKPSCATRRGTIPYVPAGVAVQDRGVLRRYATGSSGDGTGATLAATRFTYPTERPTDMTATAIVDKPRQQADNKQPRTTTRPVPDSGRTDATVKTANSYIWNSGPVVATGGGCIGEPAEAYKTRTPPDGAAAWPVDTANIDAHTLTLAKKPSPAVLLIPTAVENSPRHNLDLYVETFTQHWTQLGAGNVEVLRLLPETSRDPETATKIGAADIVFVAGGVTHQLLDCWRRHRIGAALQQASQTGTVIAGNSAGAVCWFEQACSNSHYNGPYPLRCLGWFNIDICPHWNTEPDRHSVFAQMLLSTGRHGIAVDDAAALIVDNGSFQVIADSEQTWVYRCSWRDGQFKTEPLAAAGPLTAIVNTGPPSSTVSERSVNEAWLSTTVRFDMSAVDRVGSNGAKPANN